MAAECKTAWMMRRVTVRSSHACRPKAPHFSCEALRARVQCCADKLQAIDWRVSRSGASSLDEVTRAACVVGGPKLGEDEACCRASEWERAADGVGAWTASYWAHE